MTTTKLSPLRLIQRKHEWIEKANVDAIPKGMRGIYVLYKDHPAIEGKKQREVVYVGMSVSGIKGRLRAHKKSAKKSPGWDCCSIFEVWPNIRDEEIRELEGILRHIYRFDPVSQKFNAQKRYAALTRADTIELSDAYRSEKELVTRDKANG